MFELERVKVNSGWITLHTEKLRNLYLSPNRLKVITSREKRWEGQTASSGEVEQSAQFSGNLKLEINWKIRA
jgi:hypothetical protein